MSRAKVKPADRRYAIVSGTQPGRIVKGGIKSRARAEIELEDFGPGHRIVRDREAER